ncbi:MAG TPA: Holliday junction branch migration protein RuvA [Methanoregulaceae archaeon]|nr:Holliday junction branch migration protein RuvA [Methanoregulaceae archaeon]
MIAHLYGDITSIGDNYLVLDVNGIGYRISMTETTLRRLSSHRGKLRIFTHLIVRDDSLSLAGFLESSELELFLLLITVNRVGPQMALSILSQITPTELVQALTGEDEKRLTRLSGVGPRNARRLILELKDRLKEQGIIASPGGTDKTGQARQDVIEALIALGFSSRDSNEAVSRAVSGITETDTRALLKSALGILKEDRRG